MQRRRERNPVSPGARGRFPKSGDGLRGSIALPPNGLFPLTGEAHMEIRNQTKTGPVVPPLAEITATLSRQVDDMKQRLLDRLRQHPASIAKNEVEDHEPIRRLPETKTA